MATVHDAGQDPDDSRDATRGGVNAAALPQQRGREGPLSIDRQPEPVRRLVHAWISIGIGGLTMLTSSSFVVGSLGHPSRFALGVAAVGAFLALRGAAVVKQIKHDLTPIGAPRHQPLPVARML